MTLLYPCRRNLFFQPAMVAAESGPPRKIRRISRACDYCHHRSIRCRSSEEEDRNRCQNCVDFNQPCTYNRPAKRRGVKARQRSSSATSSFRDDQSNVHKKQESVSHQNGISGHPQASPAPPINSVTPVSSNVSNSDQWRAPYIASQALIMDLVEVYFEVIYPM
jgi:Fungal Zn(2)-Cys(6) binuclear cluster domain